MADGKVVWTAERLELRDWLRRNGASLAELYEGTVMMLYLHDPLLPGWSRLVGHAVREIRNRLPDTVAGKEVSKKKRVDYKLRLDGLAGVWPHAGFAVTAQTASPDAAPPVEATVTIPHEIHDRISELIREHQEARERPVEAAFRLFEAISPANKGQRAALEPTLNQWIKVTDWFQSIAHDGGIPDGSRNVEEYRRQFQVFETMLSALIHDFFRATDELDKILEDTNS
jgi:hypothetical protein